MKSLTGDPVSFRPRTTERDTGREILDRELEAGFDGRAIGAEPARVAD